MKKTNNNTPVTDLNEISIDERMEINYFPKIISKSLKKKTNEIGEK